MSPRSRHFNPSSCPRFILRINKPRKCPSTNPRTPRLPRNRRHRIQISNDLANLYRRGPLRTQQTMARRHGTSSSEIGGWVCERGDFEFIYSTCGVDTRLTNVYDAEIVWEFEGGYYAGGIDYCGGMVYRGVW